jgi:hypothetical protein
MALTVKSATYGDETATTNITDVVSGKMKDGKIKLTVGDSLLPIFTGDEKVELDDEEKQTIRAQAVKECNGNANDTQCINATVNRISQAKMDEKLLNQQRAGAMKGKRLNVTFVDSRGREIKRIVPKGQTLTMGYPPVKDTDTTSVGTKVMNAGLTVVTSSATIIGIVGGVVFLVLWVFSVGTTWKTFMKAGLVKQGYAFTAASVLIPLSGFILTPGYFAFLKYYTKSK